MNRLISHGQAIRSTLAFSRVTHFMSSPPDVAGFLAVHAVEELLEGLDLGGKGAPAASGDPDPGSGPVSTVPFLDRDVSGLLQHLQMPRQALRELELSFKKPNQNPAPAATSTIPGTSTLMAASGTPTPIREKTFA